MNFFFRRKTDNWEIELSANVRFPSNSNLILTAQETKFIKKLRIEQENRAKKRQIRNQTISRVSDESSNYSTSKEFKQLFEPFGMSSSSDEDKTEELYSAYKPLPDFLKDFENLDRLNNCQSEELDDAENRQSTSNYVSHRAERYRMLKDADNHSSEEEEFDPKATCRGYKMVKYPRTSVRKKRTKEQVEKIQLGLNNDPIFEKRCQICLKQVDIRNCQNREEHANCVCNRQKLKTLGEVLLKRGLSSEVIICCRLCRLLISTKAQGESFMSPCGCSESFVHTECVLLHKDKMTMQRCKDCQKFYIYRTEFKPSSLYNIEDLKLFKLNQIVTERKRLLKEEPILYNRLPVEFERDCCICFDSRTARCDSFEELDSKIIRPCRCNVTCHNECLVETLLNTRTCEYCNYRIQFTMIESRIGYWNTELGLTTAILQLSVLSFASMMIFVVFQYIQTSNYTFNVIAQNISIAVILVIAAYMIVSIMHVSKRISQERNPKAEVLIKPYGPSRIKKGLIGISEKNVKQQYEEVPYEETNTVKSVIEGHL